MYHKKKNISEMEYKAMRLKKVAPQFEGKRIAIYGVGENTKYVLDYIRSIHVLGLIDKECVGKYIYGKRVMSKEEALLLNIDTILIAATPEATQIVYERIKSFCMNHNIAIFDMYGRDEFSIHRKILEQEIEYPGLEEEKVKANINANEVIIIPFKEVICSEIVSDAKTFYEKIEKSLMKEGIVSRNFASKRMLAGKKAFLGTDVSRRVVYELLSSMVHIDEEQIEYIKKFEEKSILENFIPRMKVIELLEYAIEQGKEVYIYSDLLDGEEMLDVFFEPYGITQYKKILASPNRMMGMLGAAIRVLGEQYGYDKVLCLGAGMSLDLIMPQLHGTNFQLIQGSISTFFKNTNLQITQDIVNQSSNRNEIIRSIIETYNSPFLNQIDSSSHDEIIAEKIGWRGEEGTISVDIFPVKLFETADSKDKISFPKSESPQVSIIISVYNRFEYLYNCLKSILFNTDTVTYEVIVVDNDSCDFMLKLEELVSGLTVLHKYYHDIEKVAKGDYLVFLDSAAQVQVNWLYPLVKSMEMNTNTGLVGAKIVYQNGSLQDAGGIVWNNGNICKYGEGKKPDTCEYCYVREVDFVSGTAMMIRKELWNDIGCFDEAYISREYIDADLAYEVRKRGKKVLFQPDSVVACLNSVNEYKDVECEDNWNIDRNYFLSKWGREISKKQNLEKQNILSASERKQTRKTVLFISEHIPTYDKDAGSRTVDFYIQEFLERGYIVKFLPVNFKRNEPYTHRLEQMGVEVLGGEHYRKTIINWICRHYKDIDFAFLNYPNASAKFIDILKKFDIPVMYYGVDLHYLRLQREYELFGNKDKANQAKAIYEKEAYLIKNSNVVYYPSLVETQIVRKEFQREAKQLLINIYDTKNLCNTYRPAKRDGIMFIGSYDHAPNADAIQWFSECIFPHIYSRLKIPFYIVGSNMPKDLIRTGGEGIEVLGMLTDSELEKIYNTVKMAVVPLRYGAGIKGKVIESMYHGIPTVTTPIGIEGIPNEDNTVEVVDGEEEFAKAVIELYQSDEKLVRMSESGQDVIKRFYSREAAWNNIAEDFS